MDNKETAILGILIISFFAFFGGIIGIGYWDQHQTRVMYQIAYAKNQECRIASQKSGFTNSVEKICGPIPEWKDYQNE